MWGIVKRGDIGQRAQRGSEWQMAPAVRTILRPDSIQRGEIIRWIGGGTDERRWESNITHPLRALWTFCSTYPLNGIHVFSPVHYRISDCLGRKGKRSLFALCPFLYSNQKWGFFFIYFIFFLLICIKFKIQMRNPDFQNLPTIKKNWAPIELLESWILKSESFTEMTGK